MNAVAATSILNKHKKRDSWFLTDYSVNPYQGCSFNCLYCYIRGSKYGVEMKVSVKKNAPEIFEKQLSLCAKKKDYGFIALASATDPYIPIEEETRLTRAFLQIILKFRFPVYVMSRSNLIFRDLDLLHQINKHAIIPKNLQQRLHNGVLIASSFCTVDETIASRFEPNAGSPAHRMKMLGQLKKEGFVTGAHFIPLLPGISDTDEQLEYSIRAAKEHDIDYILAGTLTLFGEKEADSKTLVLKIIDRYYPEHFKRYTATFSGKDYVSTQYQKNLEKKVRGLCRKADVQYGIG